MAYQGPQATESVTLTISTNGFNVQGATVVLLVRATGTTTWTALPCVVNAGGQSVFYVTQPTDFPTAGQYDIQLKSTISGLSNYSPITEMRIGSVIG